MDNVQAGLLVKDAVVRELPAHMSKTVIVTANGQVRFTNGHDLNTGMKFTLDQWNEIVQFVESQLDAVGDKAQRDWEPDWSGVPQHLKYIGVDKNGKVHAYEVAPDADENYNEWLYGEEGGDFKELYGQSVPEGLNWKARLFTRPIQTPKHANCPCHIS